MKAIKAIVDKKGIIEAYNISEELVGILAEKGYKIVEIKPCPHCQGGWIISKEEKTNEKN